MRKALLLTSFALFLAQFGCGGGGRMEQGPLPLSEGEFTIAVQSTPTAEILVDGRSIGLRSTLLEMAPIPLPLPLVEGRPQLLTLRAEGYHDWNQWIEAAKEGAVIVKAKLVPKSEPGGEIIVISEPPGAKVTLDGVDTNATTPVRIPVAPSSHAIKVELKGFLPGYETVFVPSGEQVEVHIPLQPKGSGVVSGVIYDRFGATPSSALLELKTPQGETVAKTFSSSFGLFHFPPVPPGTYTVTAAVEFEGGQEIGQVENVVVNAGERTFVSLVVFPVDLMGSVEGKVKTPDGKPVPNAQVAVLHYAVDLDFALTSRRTLTNSQGQFRFDNIPAATQVVFARKQGYKAAYTQALVRKGETVYVELVLQPLGNLQTLQPPTQVFAISYIVPTEFLQGGTEGVRERIGSVGGAVGFYRQVLLNLLKRKGNPASEILKSLPSSTLNSNRFFPVGFFGSVGIGWQPPLSVPSEGLLGYRVYRSVPTATGWQLRLVIDEPEQTTAEDVSFDFSPCQTYRYAVTAVMLDGKETARSESVPVTFLSPIRLVEPADNEEVAQSQLKFRWAPVGASVPFYFVQLYSNPEAMLTGKPVWSTSAISGTTQAIYDGQALLKGKTYWWLVIGADDRDWLKARAFTVSQARRVVIVGD